MLRTLAQRFAVALAASLVLLVFMVTAVNWQLDSKIAGIERVDVTVDTTPRPAKAGNYLVVGSDSRDFVEDDDAGEDAIEAFGRPGGSRADAIIVVHVEPDQGELLVVSIPRDTVVERASGSRSKIADVYNDGPQALIDVITDNFDIPITHYLSVDFAGFDRVVDLVGPVVIHFGAPTRDTKTGLFVPESGCIELGGDEALAYVRSRAYEENPFGSWVTDPTGDLGRIQRQQAFLRQVAMLARDRVYASPLDVPGIVDAALATLQADPGFGRDQILGFIDRFRDVDPYDPTSVEMITLPVLDGPSGTGLGSILVLDQPAADEVLERLRTFGPSEPDGEPAGDAPAPGDPAAPDPPASDPVPGAESPSGEVSSDGGSSGGGDEEEPGWIVLPDAIQFHPDEPAIPRCG